MGSGQQQHQMLLNKVKGIKYTTYGGSEIKLSFLTTTLISVWLGIMAEHNCISLVLIKKLTVLLLMTMFVQRDRLQKCHEFV